MRKFFFFGILFFGAIGILFGVFFFYPNKKIEISQPENVQTGNVGDESVKKEKKLFVSAWVPYWATDAGLKALEENHPASPSRLRNDRASETQHPSTEGNIFSEINPFAFEVRSDGTLEDRAKVAGAVWKKARVELEQNGVRVVPTVLWGDAVAMHNILGDDALRAKHIQRLVHMTEEQNFSGIDIDYEGKDVADKENFSQFLAELHGAFSSRGKDVRCTVEARDRDDVPEDLSGVRAMGWANDFSVLARACDEVRVMAYDQVFQVHRDKTFEEKGDVPYAPNADIAWVEGVMRYALKYIPAEKLMLGVPTYGWEFRVTPIAGGYRYERVRSVTYAQATEIVRKTENGKQKTEQDMRNAGGEEMRNTELGAQNVGGERDFVYEVADGRRLVNFSDAEAIRQKLQLARTLGIKGVSIFKIDGLSDPRMFGVIENGE